MNKGNTPSPIGRDGLVKAILDILIILAVALTLTEEGMIVANASWRLRMVLSWALACFDILFTILAAARTARGFADGRLRAYMRESGWIDILSSTLPLIFTTGPFLFDASRGVTATTTLMALGNFRLLRGLGLLRSLRLLHFFRLAESERTAAIALAASLAVFIAAEGASLSGVWPDAHEALSGKREATMAALAAAPGADNAEAIARVDRDLLLVRDRAKVVYTRYSAEEYRRHFGPDEIGYQRGQDGVEAFFSLRGELRAEAAASLVSGLSAVAVLAALALGLRKRPATGDVESQAVLPRWALPAQGDLRGGPSVGNAGREGMDAPAGPEELSALLDIPASGENQR